MFQCKISYWYSNFYDNSCDCYVIMDNGDDKSADKYKKGHGLLQWKVHKPNGSIVE